MKKIALLFFLTISATLAAQQAASSFLRFGLHDGRILAKEYLRPFGEILGSNLNGGWYSNAGIHKVGGFDVSVVATYGMVPSKYEFYDLQKLAPSLQNFAFDPASSMTGAPTVAGKLLVGQQMPSLVYKNPGGSILAPPALPNGTDFDAMISPAIQGTVGLPFNTELMARFMPKVSYKDYGQANLFGVGIKHSLWDDLPFLNRIPFLRLSVMGAYSHFNSDIVLDNISFNNDVENIMRVSSDAMMARLLVGAEFPVVAVYGGLGYGHTRSSFDLKGTFSVTDFDEEGPYVSTMTDPLSLSYTKSNIDFNAGVRLKLLFLMLHADYTVSEYQAVTVGIGFHFR